MSQPEGIGDGLDVENRLRRVLGRLGEKFCITVLIKRIDAQFHDFPRGIGGLLPGLRLVPGIAQGAGLEIEHPGAKRQCSACGGTSLIALGRIRAGQNLRNVPQFIDDEADHLRPVGARASDLRDVGRIDDQRRLVVIGRQHRIVKGAEETRLRLHLGDGFGRKLLVEADMLKQHVATAYAGVGILPAAGEDASVGRVAALGEIVPVERIGIVVGVGRRALLHDDGHPAEHAAVAQREITARQSALRIFGAVPEGLVAVSARRLEVHRTRDGRSGQQQAQPEVYDLFHFPAFCR